MQVELIDSLAIIINTAIYCCLFSGLAWPVAFLALWKLASKEQPRVNPSISPDSNGVHKKHALNLPAMIGINKPVMASGFKEWIPRGVHPDE